MEEENTANQPALALSVCLSILLSLSLPPLFFSSLFIYPSFSPVFTSILLSFSRCIHPFLALLPPSCLYLRSISLHPSLSMCLSHCLSLHPSLTHHFLAAFLSFSGSRLPSLFTNPVRVSSILLFPCIHSALSLYLYLSIPFSVSSSLHSFPISHLSLSAFLSVLFSC